MKDLILFLRSSKTDPKIPSNLLQVKRLPRVTPRVGGTNPLFDRAFWAETKSRSLWSGAR